MNNPALPAVPRVELVAAPSGTMRCVSTIVLGDTPVGTTKKSFALIALPLAVVTEILPDPA
ncbi:hypothetical protein [Ralstonia wenshanensis]|uniref:hypothetical protein n=1 Tax=Ralstonia wenshanensis TaxID=2842456 RepID=UPI003A5A7647